MRANFKRLQAFEAPPLHPKELVAECGSKRDNTLYIPSIAYQKKNL
jgi:hypothetical protein